MVWLWYSSSEDQGQGCSSCCRNPSALCVHCCSCVSWVQPIRNYIGTTGTTGHYFRSSRLTTTLVEKIGKVFPNTKRTKLTSMCERRLVDKWGLLRLFFFGGREGVVEASEVLEVYQHTEISSKQLLNLLKLLTETAHNHYGKCEAQKHRWEFLPLLELARQLVFSEMLRVKNNGKTGEKNLIPVLDRFFKSVREVVRES